MESVERTADNTRGTKEMKYLILLMLATPTIREIGIVMNHDERLIWNMRWGLHRSEVLIEQIISLTEQLDANRLYIREHFIRDAMGSK